MAGTVNYSRCAFYSLSLTSEPLSTQPRQVAAFGTGVTFDVEIVNMGVCVLVDENSGRRERGMRTRTGSLVICGC